MDMEKRIKEPKYQIGDKIENSNMVVRGVMTDSRGTHRYFIQIWDNSIVIDEWYINKAIEIVEDTGTRVSRVRTRGRSFAATREMSVP